MATYKVKMVLQVEFDLDTLDHEFEDADLNQEDPKDVHKYLQHEWEEMGIVEHVVGQWTLNELKVVKEG